MGKLEQIQTDSAGALRVETITDMKALKTIGRAWDALCARDSETILFLTPQWLAPVLAERPGTWMVLAVYDGQQLVGLLPLWRRAFRHRDSGKRRVELEAAGRMIWSEYSGFLCDPDYEDMVLQSLANRLKQEDFTVLMLPYVSQPGRARTFAKAFGPGFAAGFPPMVSHAGRVDRQRCPRLRLLGDYDSYVETTLGPKSQAKLKEATGYYIDSGMLRMEDIAASPTFEARLEEALCLWQGNQNADDAKVERFRTLLYDLRGRGLLTMPSLFERDTLIGSLANIVDVRMGYELYKMAALDETRSDIPVMLLLQSQAIKAAISRGRLVYDLGHGNEPWKYSLGAEDVVTETLVIKPRGG